MSSYRYIPFFIYKTSGNSMYPFLVNNQKVVGLHWIRQLVKNEVVIVSVKNKLVIKRIIKIKNDEIWIEGDNKKESTDSREFGWINKSKVIAKVLLKL